MIQEKLAKFLLGEHWKEKIHSSEIDAILKKWSSKYLMTVQMVEVACIAYTRVLSSKVKEELSKSKTGIHFYLDDYDQSGINLERENLGSLIYKLRFFLGKDDPLILDLNEFRDHRNLKLHKYFANFLINNNSEEINKSLNELNTEHEGFEDKIILGEKIILEITKRTNKLLKTD